MNAFCRPSTTWPNVHTACSKTTERSAIVTVRPWCPGDEIGVWKVLKDGSFSNVRVSFLLVLKKRVTSAVVVGVGSFALGYSRYFAAALLTVAVTLCSLYCLTWLFTLMYLYGPPLWDMKNVTKNYFSDEDSGFWVAEFKGQVVGTIAIVKREHGKCGHQKCLKNKVDDVEKVAWLRRMAVLRECRGRGVAKSLVETAVQFCKSRDYDKVELITTEVHQAARKLYEKCGFTCTAYLPHKYWKGLVRIWTYEYELPLR
ncbi:N-acetyltransferase 8-like [Liolophura sinensis]|uniref:N-acetyltransferase 8-like n=1 Tax=Liolophura sinensis TaxID=3198878 RepID=UPI0031599090